MMPRKETCNCEPSKGIAAQTAKEAGYRMPAEWARHEATWLSWPKNPLTFPGNILPQVERIYAQVVTALSRGERVKILIDDQGSEDHARSVLEDSAPEWKNVIFLHIPSADVWVRDYGPTFVLSRDKRMKAAVKWVFNAWGGKYDDLLADNVTGEEIVRKAGLRSFRPNIVMEGGSLDVNGEGTVLTTEQCLLNPNRNSHLSKAEIEAYLEDYLDAPSVIWLSSGIDGDDTDGHVDDFARFVAPRQVVCSHSHSDLGGNRSVLEKNLRILKRARDQDGELLEVIELPMPTPIELPEEERFLPASYANFYIVNRVVLLPVFGDENDPMAKDILQQCFPDREVVSILARELVYGYGGFHCVTQQEPSVPE